MHLADWRLAAPWRAPGRASPSRPRPSPGSIRSRLRPRTRGQALVEFALIIPVFLLLALAAIDLGRIFYSQITVTNAARAGAMTAAADPMSYSAGAPCSSSNRIICSAVKEASGSFVTIAPGDITRTCSPSCATGAVPANTVTVSVVGRFSLVTPLLAAFTGGSNVLLRADAIADIITLRSGSGIVVPPSAAPSASAVPSAGASGSVAPSASASVAPSVAPCPTPLVAFTFTQQNRNRPVVFTSTSTPTSGACAITFWRWEFGDGTTDAGVVSTTSHDYGSPGTTFNVTLTVTYPSGTASLTRAVTTR